MSRPIRLQRKAVFHVETEGYRAIIGQVWGLGGQKKKNKYESSQLVTFICGLFHSFPGFPQQLSMTREHKSNDTCSSLS